MTQIGPSSVYKFNFSRKIALNCGIARFYKVLFPFSIDKQCFPRISIDKQINILKYTEEGFCSIFRQRPNLLYLQPKMFEKKHIFECIFRCFVTMKLSQSDFTMGKPANQQGPSISRLTLRHRKIHQSNINKHSITFNLINDHFYQQL